MLTASLIDDLEVEQSGSCRARGLRRDTYAVKIGPRTAGLSSPLMMVWIARDLWN
jgi:hypothetical protein